MRPAAGRRARRMWRQRPAATHRELRHARQAVADKLTILPKVVAADRPLLGVDADTLRCWPDNLIPAGKGLSVASLGGSRQRGERVTVGQLVGTEALDPAVDDWIGDASIAARREGPPVSLNNLRSQTSSERTDQALNVGASAVSIGIGGPRLRRAHRRADRRSGPDRRASCSVAGRDRWVKGG